ncbi:MAG: hypothetical protein R3A79_17445 [Nannocystaceae bacterium]
MPLRAAVVLSSALLLSACASRKAKEAAANEPTPEEIEAVCAERACRPDTPQRVQVDATHVWDGVYPRSPYVAGPGVVVILPGESFELAATPKADGTIDAMKVVPEGGDIKLVVTTKEGMTILRVSTTYDRPLHYCAYINVPGVGRVKTSIVGVFPGTFGAEMWQDPITELILTDFRLTDERTECR